jgi:predicted MPP superfamily phosphohydrolase
LPRSRLWSGLLAAAVITLMAICAVGYKNATAAPVIRHLQIRVAGYPVGAAPVRIALFSDIHVHGPDMPPERLARIVDQINALGADIDVAAGDFVGNSLVGGEYPVAEAIAPLNRLKAPLGVYAVLGNNDYRAGADEVTRALEEAGVHVLTDDAVRVGPLALGGRAGRLFRKPKPFVAARARTFAAIDRTPGIPVLIAHRPDEFARAPKSIGLVLAGHTHCGQIVLPLIGPLETGSDFGRKYSCGVIRDGSRTLVVTAGLGTSYVPLRIGAPPDIWLISITG